MRHRICVLTGKKSYSTSLTMMKECPGWVQSGEICTTLLLLRSLTVGSGFWLLFPRMQNALKVFSTSVYEWSDFKTSKIPNYFGTCSPFVSLSLMMFLSYILEHTGLCISNLNRTSVHGM